MLPLGGPSALVCSVRIRSVFVFWCELVLFSLHMSELGIPKVSCAKLVPMDSLAHSRRHVHP